MHPAPIRQSFSLTVVAALLSVATVSHAQCVGDCDSSHSVTVNELVLGTNIALERAQLSQCLVFDNDDSGNVTVNELVTGVNNLLRDCPAVVSTATPTPTPTTSGPTATPTATSTAIAGCGNATVDFDLGETCDDGNLEEGPGDDCPADCRIATCTASGDSLDVDVSFLPPAGVDLAAVQVFVTYPEDRVRIPGRGNANQVLDRFSNTADVASYSFNDQDYAAAVLAFTDGAVIPPGRLLTVTFDRCGAVPVAADFACRVISASPSADGVTCTATIP
jgi:hypothetical protein